MELLVKGKSLVSINSFKPPTPPEECDGYICGSDKYIGTPHCTTIIIG